MLLQKRKYVMHRITAIVEENGEIKYETTGDNNNGPDSELVPKEEIVGRIKFSIPYIGYPSVWLAEFLGNQNPGVETGN